MGHPSLGTIHGVGNGSALEGSAHHERGALAGVLVPVVGSLDMAAKRGNGSGVEPYSVKRGGLWGEKENPL